MQVILLGTGTPRLGINNPRAGSSAALVIGDDVLLFDCGRWVTLRLSQAGIHPNQVTHFFFTHIFHFDHTCNYYDFLMSVKPQKLNIYGPPGTKEYTKELLQLHAKYGEERINTILDWIKNHTMDVKNGIICSESNWKVKAINIDKNTNWPTNIIYRIEQENLSIVIAWDIHPRHDLFGRKKPELGTIWKYDDTYTSRKELMDFMEGADLMITDAMGIHTTPEGIGIAAERTKVKKLILTHLSDPKPGQYLELTSIKERVEKVFRGKVIIGKDLMTMKI